MMTRQKVNTIDNSAFVKDTWKLCMLEGQAGKIFAERYPFQQRQSRFRNFFAGILLENLRVAILVTASKQNLAAMIVIDEKLQ